MFFGFLALLSLAISAGLRIFRAYETELAAEMGMIPISDTFLWRWLPVIISVVMIFTVFVGIYRFFPARKNTLAEVWPGAAAGAVAFEIAKNLFVAYLGSTPPQAIIHGSLTAMVVLLLWIYVMALIVLLGAEFNVMLLRRRENAEGG